MFRNSFGKSHAGAGKAGRLASVRAIFRGHHPAIPPTVAYSAIFVTTGQEQHGKSDGGPTAKDAKYGFGGLIDLAHAEPVAGLKHGRSVVVVMPVEESSG